MTTSLLQRARRVRAGGGSKAKGRVALVWRKRALGAPASWWEDGVYVRLGDDDAERRRACGKGRRGRGQLGQVAAVHGEGTDGASAGVDDPKRAAVGAEPSVLGTHVCRTERGAAEEAQRAVAGDRVSRDAVAGRVDREEELPVVADLDPAWRGLEVREGRGADRCERAVTSVAESGDRSVAGAAVCVGNEQLRRIGGAVLTPERAGALSGERRAGRGREEAVRADDEAVDHRRADHGTNEPGSVTVEEDVTGRRSGRQSDGRAGDRSQVAAGIEREAGVVAAAVAGVGHIHQASVDGDADGLDAAGGNRAPSDGIQLAVVVDPQHRDLVAAGIDREQVLAVTRDLQRSL